MIHCEQCGYENKEDAQYCTECGRFLQQPQEAGYPLYFKGELTEPLSELLWQIKILLLVPHYVILCFLWFGFALAWFVSLLAIMCTSRYPRKLFDFNLGVLRWSWRVMFYGYGVLGTDRYPPFTLKSVDYPADLDMPHPEQLSRKLPPIKFFMGFLLVVYIAVRYFILFWYTGFVVVPSLFIKSKYPRDSFDFLLGFSRLTYRMTAYVALMTDQFPPFRLRE